MRRSFLISVCCFLICCLKSFGQCTVQLNLVDKTDAVCYGTPTGSAVAEADEGTAPYSYFWTNGTNTFTGSIVHYIPAGHYKVTVTDANNCTASLEFDIGEPKPLSHHVSYTNSTCNLPNGQAVITASEGVAPYRYRWSDDIPHGSSPTDLPPAQYVVTIYDDHRCQDTVHIDIVNQGGVNAAINSKTDVSCFRGNNGSAMVTASGEGSLTYLWRPAGGNGTTANNLAAGKYSIEVTDETGCKDTAETEILQPTEMVSTITKHDATCANKNGAASVAVSGGSGTYTYLWKPGNYTTPDISDLAAGTYTVTITDATGCFKTEQVIINTIGGPQIKEIQQKNISCYGEQNGAVSPIVSNGVYPYSFTWTNATVTYSDSSLQNLAIGTYQLTVKDAIGCTATSGVTITEPEPLSHAVTVTSITCKNPAGSAAINETGGTGPYTFIWTTTGGNEATASLLAAGDYVAYIKDDNQCGDSAHVHISSTGGLSVSIDNVTNVSCNGGNNGSATAIAKGAAPYSYLWSASGGNEQTAKNLSAATYTVTVTDAEGCMASASVQITEPSAITTTMNAHATTCGNDNGSADVTVTGGTGLYSYNWAPGNYNTSNISNVAAGSYALTIKDGNGCVKNEAITINKSVAVQIRAIASVDVLCYGQQTGAASVEIASANGPVVFKWSGMQRQYYGNTIQNVDAGTYQLTVTDSAGCTATGNVTINQPEGLSHQVKITAATCAMANGSAVVSEIGGTAPYSYAWSSSPETSSSWSTLLSGDYTVYIKDANQCRDTANIHITNLGGVSASIVNKKDVSCFGANNGSASVTASGDFAPFSYAWTNGVNSADISNLVAGDYSVTVKDQQGCTAVASTHIAQPDEIKTSVSVTNTSCNNANGIAAVTVTGGTAPYSYAWFPDNASTSDINNLAAGHYVVAITDANSCQKVDSAIIQPSFNPVIDSISHTNVTCFGKENGSATANVSGGITPYSYRWKNNEYTFTTTSIRNVGAGNYQFTVTDAAGCTASASAIIAEPSELKLQVDAVSTTCGTNNGAATVIAAGGVSPYQYLWSTGRTSNAVSNLSAGSYMVSCTDANGCIATTNRIRISSSLPLRISLGKDTSICPGGQAILSPGKFATYTWQDGSTAPVYSASQTGVYTVSVADSTGCTASSSVKVSVNCPDIVFPDAFSPNGDGHNDKFGPLGMLSVVEDYRLNIFNRWGQRVFTTTDPTNKWDGKLNGMELATGTYVWIVEYSFNGQSKKFQKGTITIIK